MAQTLTPDGDDAMSGWTGSFTDVDESPANDADYIEQEFAADVSDTFRLTFSNVNDPLVGDNHTFTIRTRIDAAPATQTGSWVAALKQGAATIATFTAWVDTDGAGFADHTFTLTQVQKDAISDYNDLKIEISFTSNAGNSVAVDAQCSWIEGSVPDLQTIHYPAVMDTTWKELLALSAVRDSAAYSTVLLYFVMDGGFWKALVEIT